MLLALQGTVKEINDFLYGDSHDLERIVDADNPNIPIGDNNPSCDSAGDSVSDDDISNLVKVLIEAYANYCKSAHDK